MILAWIILLWTLPLTVHAQITNALVTITTAPTNGASISINGNVRTWTNNVSTISSQLPLTTMFDLEFTNTATAGDVVLVNASNIWTFVASSPNPTNQVLAGTNSANSATNFYLAYSNNPSPFTTVSFAPGTSNQIVIFSYFGVPVTVAISPTPPAATFAAVLATNDIGIQATNLFMAYGFYKSPSTMNVFQGPATNQVGFLSFPGTLMNLTFPAPGWASVAFTGYVPTNLTPVMVPDGAIPISAMSANQRSNEESGLVALLNDYPTVASNLFGGTNIIYQTNSIWTQFLGTNFGFGLTNFILTLSTNSTNYASNLYVLSTNYTWIESTNSTNWTIQWAGILATNNTNFTLFASNYLWTLFDPLLGAINPWQNAGHDVYLTNDNAASSGANIPRFYQQEYYGGTPASGNNGVTAIYPSDGTATLGNGFFYNDANVSTIIYDVAGVQRLQILSEPSGNTNTYLWGGSGRGLTVGGLQGTVFGDRPIVMQSNVQPAVAIGTITNFQEFQVTSDTIYNSNNISGSALTNKGDTIIRDIGMSFAAGSGYSFDLYFCSQAIFASGAFNAISGGSLSLRAIVTLDGAGNFRYSCSGIASDLTTNSFSTVGHYSLSGNTNFYIGVIADVGSDDITVELDNETLCPSSKWGYMP